MYIQNLSLVPLVSFICTLPGSANENFSLEVISSESRLPSGLFSFYSSLLSGYLKENIRAVSLSKVVRWHFFS